MAKKGTVLFKLLSSAGTGYFYVGAKNTKLDFICDPLGMLLGRWHSVNSIPWSTSMCYSTSLSWHLDVRNEYYIVMIAINNQTTDALVIVSLPTYDWDRMQSSSQWDRFLMYPGRARELQGWSVF
jgi:hypothetical protein